MTKTVRALLLVSTAGWIWYFALQLLFVWSGAQRILADPVRQSSKFIKAFTAQPRPMMAEDPTILWKGLWVAGAFLAVSFLIINTGLKGNWLKRGIVFGLLHWMIMVPWFEFYLPYNVMREPLPLVLFEGLLWLGLTMLAGVYQSCVINYKMHQTKSPGLQPGLYKGR